MASGAGGRLLSVDFEVFGRVQGVFFRKFTREKAKELGLVGWVKNTYTDTVVGVAQGPDEKMRIMRHWLMHEGSRRSRIDKCEFKNGRQVDNLEFKQFSIKR